MAAKKKTTNAPTEESPKTKATALKKTSATQKPDANSAAEASSKIKSQKTLATESEPATSAPTKKGIRKPSSKGSPAATDSTEEKNTPTDKASPVKKVFTPAKSNEAPAIVVEPINDPDFIAFVALQKQRLLDLRDELVDIMTGSAREAIRNAPEGSEASGSGMHQGDAGSDAYDRDFALGLLAKEQDALYEIEEALQRIKKRTYGICEMSGKRIPIARLEAIPFARLTVDCQAQWEKEYGNRKFRPSGSVGFSGGVVYDDDEDSETVSLDDDDD